MSHGGPKLIGVISDTHGLLRPEAAAALMGCDLIIHAGDIGAASVVTELESIAPVVAVRGNIDRAPWAEAFPNDEVVKVDGRFLYVLHDLNELDLDPVAAGFHAVITGHTHKPSIEHRNGVLYLNPGSAGPRRFTLPICLAKIEILGEELFAEIIHLRV